MGKLDKYILVFAVEPSLSETQIGAILSKFEKKINSLGGNIISRSKPVIRKFATRLRKHTSLKEALFIEIEFGGPSNLPNELNSLARVSEEVVRYIIVKSSEKNFSRENKEIDSTVEVNPEMLIGKPE